MLHGHLPALSFRPSGCSKEQGPKQSQPCTGRLPLRAHISPALGRPTSYLDSENGTQALGGDQGVGPCFAWFPQRWRRRRPAGCPRCWGRVGRGGEGGRSGAAAQAASAQGHRSFLPWWRRDTQERAPEPSHLRGGGTEASGAAAVPPRTSLPSGILPCGSHGGHRWGGWWSAAGGCV